MFDTSRLKGFSSLLVAAFIYGLFGVLVRYISPMFGDNFQVALRFILAALIITIFNFLRNDIRKFPRNNLIKISLLGVAFACVGLLLTYSVLNTKLANTVFLLYAGSLTSAFLIGTFVFKEKVTIMKTVAIAMASIGISMYSDVILGLSLGIITGLAAGIFDGIQNSLRKTLKEINRNVVLQYSYIAGSIFAIIVTFISGEQILKSFSLIPIGVIIFYAVLLLILGNFLLYGFQHYDVNLGTVVLSLELVFALLFGFFLYREIPTTKELIGGSFIFIASILSGIGSK